MRGSTGRAGGRGRSLAGSSWAAGRTDAAGSGRLSGRGEANEAAAGLLVNTGNKWIYYKQKNMI